MYKPRFSIGQFNGDWDEKVSERAIHHLLNALIEINLDYLRENPAAPKLYESGIYYRRVIEDHNGDDDWADIPSCFTNGYGDCEDLVAWRVAELRMQGIHAVPGVRLAKNDDARLYHVFVLLPDGSVEDPSAYVDLFGYFARGAA